MFYVLYVFVAGILYWLFLFLCLCLCHVVVLSFDTGCVVGMVLCVSVAALLLWFHGFWISGLAYLACDSVRFMWCVCLRLSCCIVRRFIFCLYWCVYVCFRSCVTV